MTVLTTKWRRKPAGIDMERNYVAVTLCIRYISFISITITITAFSALTLLVGRQEGHPACKKTEWWNAGMVICLE